MNGKPLATDLFPRFENPFVRSGVVEWGQRTYCLEWNGHTLLHDFSDSRHPVRQESPEEKPGDAETIVALVIYLRTGEEAMEAFTVATASSWLVAGHPPSSSTWHDHHDLFALDARGRRWYQRTTCGGTMGFWRELDATGEAPDWTLPFSWAAVTDPTGQAGLFVVSQGRLVARVSDFNGVWSEPWNDLSPMVPGLLVPPKFDTWRT